jgi:CubicO group peptidase (beta-lactamase class C family)
VRRYLPWFRLADHEPSAQITVRHLLNQTSGLSASSGWIPLSDFDEDPDAGERQARMLASLSLGRPVGSAFEYSNANYNLLGLVIEAVSGESYTDYVRKHIFSPLDMNHSYASQAMARQDGLAMGHQYWFWFPVAAPELSIPHGSLASGQLFSTSEDMGHFLIAFLNGGRYQESQVLSDEGIAELVRGVAEQVEMGVSMGKYAMGWYAGDIDQTQIAWHAGMVPDFSSYMAILPEQKKGIVLLFNADHFLMNPILGEVGEGAARLLAGLGPEPARLGFIPWMMRGLLLIPVLQIIGVVTTLGLLKRWRQDSTSRPDGTRKWGLYILLPLIPNLLVASTLLPLRGAMRGFWMLFAPDFSLIALICGSFAGAWAVLRTGLILGALRSSS